MYFLQYISMGWGSRTSPDPSLLPVMFAAPLTYFLRSNTPTARRYSLSSPTFLIFCSFSPVVLLRPATSY